MGVSVVFTGSREWSSLSFDLEILEPTFRRKTENLRFRFFGETG